MGLPQSDIPFLSSLLYISLCYASSFQASLSHTVIDIANHVSIHTFTITWDPDISMKAHNTESKELVLFAIIPISQSTGNTDHSYSAREYDPAELIISEDQP